mmetsp:Transcript_12837/g.40721  ORF Transcript_12837/g.40721 Transcript_12837/m.40721 type:complete len:352 (+) Transcript_12837:325-1380(+)
MGEGLDAEFGHGDAEAGGGATGPGEIGRGAVAAVPVGRAGLGSGEEGEGSVLVRRVDGGGQAVVGVVDECEGLVVVADSLDGDDRAEALVSGDVHVVVDVDEDRRREVAGRGGGVETGELRGAASERVVDLPTQEGGLRGEAEGADECVGGPLGSHLESGNGRDQGRDEVVVDGIVDVDALDRAARLARVVAGAVGESGRDARDVGDVVRDVGGVLAPELELELDHARGSGRRDLLPRRVRAGEEYAVDVCVDERRAGRRRAVERRERAVGDARLAPQRLHEPRRPHRVLRRLVDHRVPRDEAGSPDVQPYEVRVVPRRDVCHDAQRLSRDHLLHRRRRPRHARRQSRLRR